MKYKSRLFLGSCLAKDETPDNSQLMSKLFGKLRGQDPMFDFYSLIGLINTTKGYTEQEKQKAWGFFRGHEDQGDFIFIKR